MKLYILTTAIALVAACEAPTEATKTAADAATAFAEANRLSALPTIATPTTGSASFAGFVAGTVNEPDPDYEFSGDFIGDLAMEVDFERSIGNVTGTIDNVSLVNVESYATYTTPDQDLSGSLDIAGSLGTNLRATATGYLAVVQQEGPFSESWENYVEWELSGGMVSDGGNRALAGSVSDGFGSFDGYDLDIQDANFYAKER